MLTSSGSGGISPIGRTKTYYSCQKRGAAAPTVSGHNYDSATFSSLLTGKDASQMDAVSRLSREVRTATTTGDIQALRQEVCAGVYTPDPKAIAGRILFLVEDQSDG